MASLVEKTDSANSRATNRLQTLIIGRLFIIFLLLVTSWLWYSGNLVFSIDIFPRSLLVLFIVSIGLTVIYFFLARISKRLDWQYWLQFSLDALLVTWLVWRTGDVTSPYITLYFVLISIASAFFRPNSTLALALICAGLLCGLAVTTSLEVIERTGPANVAAKVVQIVSFNLVAMLVVGLLASRLSDRRSSGEELAETAKTLASLRALHERIIESIRSGLITTDLEGNIFSFNAAALEITGRNSEQMTGRPISELFGDITEQIEIALENSADLSKLPRFETDLATPDGFAVRIGYTISQLFSEANEPSGLIISFQDLTQIRSMEESSRRKDRLAAVGRVGAGLAHEIRNPLGAMRGAIQVLESSMPPESVQADLMTIILRESDRLNSIISNFLSYARPKAANFEQVDVCDAIRDTATLLKHGPDVNDKHNLTLRLPDKPVTIHADATQLKQIFWNVARNAFQAMPDGGDLKISLETIRNNRIRIVVEDNGHGMPPEQVEQLFEPFSNSTSGGTGLGLSIVYQIIRDHNGTINVRSSQGEGTVITVELPREASPRLREDGRQPSEDKAPIGQFLKVRPEETKVSS